MSDVTYFIEAVGLNRIKIGSVRADRPMMRWRIQNRCNFLNIGSPVQLRVICTTTRFREKGLHKKFARFRIKGEWFEGVPEIWCFIDYLFCPLIRKAKKNIRDDERGVA